MKTLFTISLVFLILALKSVNSQILALPERPKLVVGVVVNHLSSNCMNEPKK
ncbi:hypothetical protein SAMN05216436_11227 [bacterium A37T11]|nr:hypothetical protein SAMN05216436_11227 [bacterium A37T11]